MVIESQLGLFVTMKYMTYLSYKKDLFLTTQVSKVQNKTVAVPLSFIIGLIYTTPNNVIYLYDNDILWKTIWYCQYFFLII